jgi:Uma2 family endonuclease
MTGRTPTAYRLTYRDWLQLPDDGRLYEVLEGELFVAPPPSLDHQFASSNLHHHVGTFVRHAQSGRALAAPTGVRLDNDTVLEPDIVVVLREHADRLGEQVIEGPPDLVVEILSPATARRDALRKRRAYERHGVPEYWIVDPVARTVEVLVLHGERYRRDGIHAEGERFRSRVLVGFELDVAEVFAR